MRNIPKKRIVGTVIILFLMIILFFAFNVFKHKQYVTFTNQFTSSMKMEVRNQKIKRPNDPQKEGYMFVGWYLNDKLFDFNSEVEKNITLEAKFEKIVIKTYTVTFDSNGGNKIDIQKVEKNKRVTMPVEPIRDGYNFVGWYLDNEKFDFDTTITGNFHIVAKWEKPLKETEIKNTSNTNGSSNDKQSAASKNPRPTSKPRPTAKPTPEPTQKPEEPDVEKPNMFEPGFDVTSHSLKVKATTTDNKTKPENLVYKYSTDGTNYQNSNIFEWLTQKTEYEVWVSVTDEAGNELIINKKIITSEVAKPTNITLTPNGYTSGKVLVTAVPDADNILQYSLDGTNYINYTDPIEVTKNGSVYFRQFDLANNYSEINKLDIKLIIPTLSIRNLKATATTNSITATVDVNLSQDYIESIEYKINKPSSEVLINDFTHTFNSLEDDEEYIVYCVVKSKTGETQEIETSIYTKELVAPTLTNNASGWATKTNVTIDFKKQNETKETSYLVGGVNTVTTLDTVALDVTDNVLVEAFKSDGYNISSSKLEVKNVDIKKPLFAGPVVQSKGISSIVLDVKGIDTQSGVKGYQFAIVKDGEDESNMVYGEMKSMGVAIFNNLEKNTTYRVKIKITDNVGNYTESDIIDVATENFTSISVEIDSDKWSPEKNISIDFGILTPDYTFEYKKDDGSFAPVISSPLNVHFDQDGKITITVTDKFGSKETLEYSIDKIDNVTPTITVKTSKVELNYGTDKKISEFFDAIYGKSGGKITCTTENVKDLTSGTHKEVCTATSKAGLQASAQITIQVKVVDDSLNGSSPILYDGMIPIEILEDGTYVKADTYADWYNAKIKKWGNVVTFNNNEKFNKYKFAEPGEVIPADDVYMTYVWIPRFSYKLFNSENTTSGVARTIELQFQSKSEKVDGTCNGIYTKMTNGCFLTHPAFTRNIKELSGFWVNKFEISGTKTSSDISNSLKNIRSVPGKQALTLTSLAQFVEYGNEYQIFLSANPELGNKLVSNVITTQEWGAISYLTHSKYGICDTTSCQPIKKNQSFTTGNYNVDNSYSTALGILTSTTGNRYGVYDMVGAGQEYTMGTLDISQLKGLSSVPYYNNFNTESLIGTGIGETSGTVDNPGWYDNVYVPLTSNFNQKWYIRGGSRYDINANIFLHMPDGIGGGAKNTTRFTGIVE